MWRGFLRNKSAAYGLLFALVFFLPYSLSAAWRVYSALQSAAPQVQERIALGALSGIYLVWLLFPLLGASLSETVDISKLLIYPIKPLQIFVGELAGSFLDFSVIFLIPTLAAVFLGFSPSIVTIVPILFAVALFLLQTFSLVQAILYAGTGVLRSRRVRDLLTLAAPAIFIAAYVGWQAASEAGFDPEAILKSRLFDFATLLPPGLAAKAMISATEGRAAETLSCLAGLLGYFGATTYLASFLVGRVFSGEASDAGMRPTSRRLQARKLPLPSRANAVRRLPAPLAAMIAKESRSMLREPIYRLLLIALTGMLFLLAISSRRSSGESAHALGPTLGITAIFVIVSYEIQILCNQFGYEPGTTELLFSFPASRRMILLGKNVVFFAVLSAFNLVAILLATWLAQNLAAAPALLGYAALTMVVLSAIGNVVSIRFPFQVAVPGRKFRQLPVGESMTLALLQFVVMGVAAILMLPIVLALALPALVQIDALRWLMIPSAVGYAAALYVFSIFVSGPMLQAREIEIVEKLRPRE